MEKNDILICIVNFLLFFSYCYLFFVSKDTKKREQKIKELFAFIPIFNLGIGFYTQDIVLILTSTLATLFLTVCYKKIFNIRFSDAFQNFLLITPNKSKSVTHDYQDLLLSVFLMAHEDNDNAEALFLSFVALTRKGKLKIDFPSFFTSETAQFLESFLVKSAQKKHLDAQELLNSIHGKEPKNYTASLPIFFKSLYQNDEAFHERLVIWKKQMAEKKIALKNYHHINVLAQDSKNVKACYLMGCCYLFGLSAKKSFDNAKIYLEKAAYNGFSPAQFLLACLYQQVNGNVFSEKCSKTAYFWVNLAAAHGDDWSYELRENIGKKLRNIHDILQVQTKCRGQSFTSSLKKSEIDALQTKVRAGDANAMYELGVHYIGKSVYEKSKTLPQDDDKGFSLILQSAKKDNSLAQFKLGEMYSQNTALLGTAKQDEALKWFQKAALQNMSAAFKEVAKIYVNPDNEQFNIEQAFENYKQAAERNEAEAQYILSCFYFSGHHVAKNFSIGQAWLQKSADKNFHKAVKYINSRWKFIDIPHCEKKFVANNIDYYWVKDYNPLKKTDIKSIILCHGENFKMKVLYKTMNEKTFKHIIVLGFVSMDTKLTDASSWRLHQKINSKKEAEKFFSMAAGLLSLDEEDVGYVAWYSHDYKEQFIQQNTSSIVLRNSDTKSFLEFALINPASGCINIIDSKQYVSVNFSHVNIADTNMSGVKFVGCDFNHVAFMNIAGSEIVFDNCNFMNCVIQNCEIKHLKINQSKINKMIFAGNQEYKNANDRKILFFETDISHLKMQEDFWRNVDFQKSFCKDLNLPEYGIPVVRDIYSQIDKQIQKIDNVSKLSSRQILEKSLEKILTKRLSNFNPHFYEIPERMISFILVANSDEPFYMEEDSTKMLEMVSEFALSEAKIKKNSA